MQLRFEYRASDYREAVAAWKSIGLATPSFAPFFYLYVALVVGTMVGGILQPTAPGEPRRGLCEVSLTAMPMLLVAAYLAVFAFRRRKPSPGFIIPPQREPTGHGIWVPAAMVAMVFVVCVAGYMLTPPTPPQGAPPAGPPVPLGTALASFLIPLLPFVGMFAAILVLAFRIFRLVTVRSFELQPQLLRPHTVTVDEGGITFSDTLSDRRYAWEGLVGWHETPNVLILYRSYVTFEMLPKRAVNSAADLQALLGLLRQRIGERHRGFEPIPVAAVAPPSLP